MGKKNKKNNNSEIKAINNHAKESKTEVKTDWFTRFCNKVKKFLSIKRNWIILLVLLVIILVIVIVLTNKKKEKFALNEEYNTYPEEVRKIYTNFVSVGCAGDIDFNIKVDSGAYTLDKIGKNVLLSYLFSYLDKNNLLVDKMDTSLINKTERELFTSTLNLADSINSFEYNGYVYDIKSGRVVREKKECPKDEAHSVLHLYGYFLDRNKISIDINVSYLKDGILYDINDKKLGEYDGDVSKLSKLTQNTSYYRAVFVNENGNQRLYSIEHKNRS